MASAGSKYKSERDFVARFLLPKLDEAARVLGYGDLIDPSMEPQKHGGGIPDLVAYKGGQGLYVIEAKFKKKVGNVERDIEPRDPEVIQQAVNYAASGGYRWYATSNEKRLILFQMVPGKRPEQCIVATFEFAINSKWNEEFLRYVLGLVAASLKPLDEILVETLTEAFKDLYPEFLDSLREKKQDRKFKKLYLRWLAGQGLDDSEDTDRKIAAETTYLQINKLLFYQVIRELYPDKLRKLHVAEDEDLAEALQGYYNDIKKIDYQPIYQTDTISQVPFSRRAKERTRTLLDTLNEFDFSSMESDFLGSIYEKLIPELERKRLGQFYTPPQIAELILDLTVRRKDDTILDPACGSGTFLVKAYHRLRELAGLPRKMSGLAETYHKQLLEKVYGVDINQFPAHLSVINLAIQNPRARIDKVNVIVDDFFDIRPRQSTLFGFTSVDMAGKETEVYALPEFDVVVANPPYIRQELLGQEEKEKIKDRIESQNQKLSIGGTKNSSNIILDKQSDIYVYFFIHAINMLKAGGRLGFIASNKWLEVGYGEPFQAFMLKFTKIKYVVEFDRAIFPDADVNTAIVILEKAKEKENINENNVKFIRFKKRKTIQEMYQIIEDTTASFENEEVRVNVTKQKDLKPGKWNVYLRAPPVFQKILSNPKVRPLSELANVQRAPTTGSNEYFILDKQKVNEWKIEKRFLRPCLSSPRNARGLVINDADDYMLTVDAHVSELKGAHVLEYIKYGEKLEVEVTRGSDKGRRKLPELETLANRKPFWYALRDIPIAPIVFQYLIDVRGICLWNKINATVTDVFYYVTPKDKSNTLPLLAYLNSTLCAFLIELFGRSYGGGILKIQAYEFEQLPTLDPSKIANSDRVKLATKFEKLAELSVKRSKVEDAFEKVKSRTKKDKGLFEDEYKNELEKAKLDEDKVREELDEMIYDVLGISKSEIKQIEEGLKELQEIRKLRAQS